MTIKVNGKYYYKTENSKSSLPLTCRQCRTRIKKGADYLEAHVNSVPFCSEKCVLEFEEEYITGEDK